jgi:hypothetical protein
MTNTFFTYNPTLMSPRTAKYVEAMIREGDNFDYDEWLQRVREQEAEAKQAEATGISGKVAAQIAKPIKTSDDQHTQRPNSTLPSVLQTIRVPRVLRRPLREGKVQTPKARLRRWLEKVRRAWSEFQSSRTRDGVYKFLTAVFDLVMHYKVRRRTERLLKHAFEFADLPSDKNADPFSAVIRCTCGDASIDTKTISKWSRALRYADQCRKPDIALSTFMKRLGGINACADRYAKHFGRGK